MAPHISTFCGDDYKPPITMLYNLKTPEMEHLMICVVVGVWHTLCLGNIGKHGEHVRRLVVSARGSS